MTYQIKCPACPNLLYFPDKQPGADDAESVCTGCKYKYSLFTTSVVSFASSLETYTQGRHDKQPSYSRTYSLRLRLLNGAVQPLQFSTAGQLEKITAHPGDEILLMYAMQGTRLKDLLWIENCTTGKKLHLLHPGAKSLSRGIASSVLTLVASTVLAGVLHIPTNQLFFAASIPASVGIGTYISKRSSLKVRDRTELSRLSAEQQLLAQKYDLQQKLAQSAQELKMNQKMVQRLHDLQQKMIDTDKNVYAQRIATIAAAAKVMVEQIELAQRLGEEYAHLINLIEIEYEVSRLAEKLPNNLTSEIVGKIEQLRAIEVKKEELALRANPQKLLDEL